MLSRLANRANRSRKATVLRFVVKPLQAAEPRPDASLSVALATMSLIATLYDQGDEEAPGDPWKRQYEMEPDNAFTTEDSAGNAISNSP
jgi:hypothetical protein